MLYYIMRGQTGLDWCKPVIYRTWRKKSRTAGGLPGERGVSMVMPSCRHSACSCWNSTSETYCLSRSLVMFPHSWNAQNTHLDVHVNLWTHTSVHMVRFLRDTVLNVCFQSKQMHKCNLLWHRGVNGAYMTHTPITNLALKSWKLFTGDASYTVHTVGPVWYIDNVFLLRHMNSSSPSS